MTRGKERENSFVSRLFHVTCCFSRSGTRRQCPLNALSLLNRNHICILRSSVCESALYGQRNSKAIHQLLYVHFVWLIKVVDLLSRQNGVSKRLIRRDNRMKWKKKKKKKKKLRVGKNCSKYTKGRERQTYEHARTGNVPPMSKMLPARPQPYGGGREREREREASLYWPKKKTVFLFVTYGRLITRCAIRHRFRFLDSVSLFGPSSSSWPHPFSKRKREKKEGRKEPKVGITWLTGRDGILCRARACCSSCPPLFYFFVCLSKNKKKKKSLVSCAAAKGSLWTRLKTHTRPSLSFV